MTENNIALEDTITVVLKVPEVEVVTIKEYIDSNGTKHKTYEAADKQNKAYVIEALLEQNYKGTDFNIMRNVVHDLLKREPELVQILGARY